jgi:cobaltochelatase CobS
MLETKLSLLSLAQLNTLLTQHGLIPVNDKSLAKGEVRKLIDAGTLSAHDAITVTAVPVIKSNAQIDDGLLKQINESSHASKSAVQEAQDALNRVFSLENNIGKKFSNMESEFHRLSSTLEAHVKSISKPDDSRVSSEINVAVSKLFDQFRKEVTVEQIEVIAARTGTFELKTARDLFGDVATRYDSVDFGDLPVGVWNDSQSPELVDDYVFNPAHLHQALIALDDPLPDNVWLAGERGTGKTEFVAQLAARLKRRLFRVNFDEALERADFIGGNSIESSSVVWKPGIIVQAIQHPGAIVLLDEIGFARAQSLAALHALCERSPHRSITISETGQRIPVAQHVVFFGADNSNGHGDTSGNFAGVREQNTAFLDRFSFTLRFEYLPQDQERDLIANRTGLPVDAADLIVRFANVAREKARAGLLTQPPSLRQLFAWARSVRKGLPVEVAFKNAIINKYPADCTAELVGVFASHINTHDFQQALK